MHESIKDTTLNPPDVVRTLENLRSGQDKWESEIGTSMMTARRRRKKLGLSKPKSEDFVQNRSRFTLSRTAFPLYKRI